ncbi:hypothetical protein Nepgr_004792 [Nepenthes gracilis]|uniref:Uncharacterized protein n=1 Tax=Nepenthes gracilis TaxID=150966 RepID=A0AAD3XFK8_NEPGR|nr:hypothetical protein Nepgr_004792 [Nepenthes gracilis]
MASNPQSKPSNTVSLHLEQGLSGLNSKSPCATPNLSDVDFSDHSKRAQRLRAAVLGANDGFLFSISLMIGVGAVKKDGKTMISSE